MSDQDRRHSDQFSEDEAKRILTRASEIDASDAQHFSAAELHRIAVDSLIAPSAIERALHETTALLSEPLQHESKRSIWSPIARALGFAGIGTALGALAVTLDGTPLGPELAAAVFGPSAVFVLYRALRNRWHGSLPDFVREVVLVMGSFTLAATIVEGAHATFPALVWSAVCAVAGGAAVAITFHSRHEEPSPPRT